MQLCKMCLDDLFDRYNTLLMIFKQFNLRYINRILSGSSSNYYFSLCNVFQTLNTSSFPVYSFHTIVPCFFIYCIFTSNSELKVVMFVSLVLTLIFFLFSQMNQGTGKTTRLLILGILEVVSSSNRKIELLTGDGTKTRATTYVKIT